jgi:DNA gyrase subunit A
MPDDPTPQLADAGIQPVAIQEEMERSFLDYAMSVIVTRALPDARDGLKPVHRRILYSMFDAGHRPDRKHVKSANIVGDVMGKYHPHGDLAIYDALARMAQDFSLRYPLIDPHGNFGSPDFPPGAMRYTEARLAPLAMQLIGEIRENTVDFEPSYDNSGEEPKVLPARFPNLLVNGADGIAVGMATKIPPHNMGEVCDAVAYYLEHPDCSPRDLMRFVKGPDFPTGGIVMGTDGLKEAYTTGRGIVRMRGRSVVEEGRAGRPQIVITELPYQVSPGRFIEKVKELKQSSKLDDIADLRNETSRHGLRLVVVLKRDAIPQVVMNQLFKLTPLQDTFGVNMVALVDGVPRTLKLHELVGYYVDHQVEVVTRRTRFRLEEAERRAHVVEGLLIALDNIDDVIALIKASADTDAARQGLMESFGLSEIQANVVLDMPLRRLTALEVEKLRGEHSDLRERIADYQDILKKPKRVRAIVKDELGEVRKDYSEVRRTDIKPDAGDLDIEDLIADEELVITLSSSGYVKATSADTYRRQGRGGRGVQGANLKAEDVVTQALHTTAHSYVLMFTNTGRVYRLKGHEFPLMDRTARGQHIRNLLSLRADERVQAMIDTRDYETHRFLLFATKRGQVKKTAFSEYDSAISSGLIAVKLRRGDEVVHVLPTSGEDRIVLVSRSGMAICFDESGVRSMGRATAGVRGMSVREGDEVVSAVVASPQATLVMITSGGYGKRTRLTEFRSQARGGKGLIAIKTGGRGRGDVVGAEVVRDDDELFVFSSEGVAIRVRAGDISRQGRAATGVRVMRLSDGVTVSAVAPIPQEEGETQPLR